MWELFTARVLVAGLIASAALTVTAEVAVLPRESVTVMMAEPAAAGAVYAPVKALMTPIEAVKA